MTLNGAQTTDGVMTKASPATVDETVSRLEQVVANKGLKLFAVIDHSGEARKVGLEMPDTKLVLFGSPAAGTPIMLAAPLTALDLPLKVLVSADTDGAVWISYNDPAFVAARHHLSDDLRARVEGVEAISDAAVAADT